MYNLLEEESLHKIENCITDVEKKTSGEIVIAISLQSGEYRDVNYLTGIILALVSLVFILFSPFHIHTYFVLPDIMFFFIAGYFIPRFIPGIKRPLTSEKRRVTQSVSGARLAFFEEGVFATRERTGVLIYISLFERYIEIIPDLGVDGRIPRGRWNELRYSVNNTLKSNPCTDEIISFICKCGKLMEEMMPAKPDKADEIPNRPRVRK